MASLSMKKMQQALALTQQPPSDKTNSEPAVPRGKGRAARLLERLQNTVPSSNAAADVNKSFYMHRGCSGTSKSVVSNAVPVTSNAVFEYSVEFSPGFSSESASASFLRKYFAKIEQVYLYDDCKVYTPNGLRSTDLEYSLLSRTTGALVTLTLTFQGRRELDLSLKLFEELFEYINGHVKEPQPEVSQKYGYGIQSSKAGLILCIDCEYYSIKKANVDDMISSCKKLYGDKYCDAVDMFLKEHRIYNQQDKHIYKIDCIRWENNVLRLKDKNAQCIDVAFAQCYLSEVIQNFKSKFPTELLSEIKTLISSAHIQPWNIQFGPFMKAPARLLPKETITFGDGITCSPKQGSWQSEMLENEVVTAVELWCWVILYTIGNESLAKQLGHNILQLQSDVGMSIGQPLYFPILDDSKDAYIEALDAIIDNNVQLVVVLTPSSLNKPEPLIKHICCVCKPVPCLIIPEADVVVPKKLHETVLVMNATLGGTLWTVSLPYKNWMVCGISIHESLIDKATVGSFVASFSNDATQWYSKATFLRKEFNFHLEEWLVDTMKKHRSTNGVLPSDVVIYHVCTEETKRQIRRNYESFKIGRCFRELAVDRLRMCVVLVQQDSKVYYYKDLNCKNVPPGTLVDDVITTANSRDFFLVSYQAGEDEVARPTYYNVIIDTCNVTADAIQILTYKLCHLYYKHARIANIPAPCKYAVQLGKFVSGVTHDIPSPVLDEYLYYI